LDTLLFIDTNILLDFYRLSNENNKEFIGKIEKIASKLISTYQVEMEYKKNRQAVIINTMGQLRKPEKISCPGMFSSDRSYAAIKNHIRETEKCVKHIQSRLERVLENPVRHDNIYIVLQRIFKMKDEIKLHRGTDEANRIRDLALKRFRLGFPPRKNNDTSIGDGVNWEWIIESVIRTKSDVIIVSRDSDYGVSYNKKTHLNDWLREEFKSRIHSNATITLTPFLSFALKKMSIPVSEETERNELKLVQPTINASISLAQLIENGDSFNLKNKIDSMIANTIDEIINSEEIGTQIASTNATSFYIDEYAISDDICIEDNEIVIHMEFHAIGEHNDEVMYHGNEISGTAKAIINANENVIYEILNAEVVK
jgi:hypothetical protein